MIETRRIVITWRKGFDGFSPFTGASIVYTPEGGNPITDNVTLADPTTYTLEDLMPFTNYNISVALSNIIGTGDSVSIQVMTASLRECTVTINLFRCIPQSPIPPSTNTPQVYTHIPSIDDRPFSDY